MSQSDQVLEWFWSGGLRKNVGIGKLSGGDGPRANGGRML